MPKMLRLEIPKVGYSVSKDADALTYPNKFTPATKHTELWSQCRKKQVCALRLFICVEAREVQILILVITLSK
jgi:hypothetical protein